MRVRVTSPPPESISNAPVVALSKMPVAAVRRIAPPPEFTSATLFSATVVAIVPVLAVTVTSPPVVAIAPAIVTAVPSNTRAPPVSVIPPTETAPSLPAPDPTASIVSEPVPAIRIVLEASIEKPPLPVRKLTDVLVPKVSVSVVVTLVFRSSMTIELVALSTMATSPSASSEAELTVSVPSLRPSPKAMLGRLASRFCVAAAASTMVSTVGSSSNVPISPFGAARLTSPWKPKVSLPETSTKPPSPLSLPPVAVMLP